MNLKHKAISSFIASLVLLGIVVLAGIIIYQFTLGYLVSGNPLESQNGALQIQSITQKEPNLIIYIKNIGNAALDLDPNSNAQIYIEDTKIPSSSYTMTDLVVNEGVTSTITITPIDQTWRGRAINIKVVASDGTFAQTTKNIS